MESHMWYPFYMIRGGSRPQSGGLTLVPAIKRQEDK